MKSQIVSLLIVIAALIVSPTAIGGFTEEIGGYKARLSITQEAPANMEDYYKLDAKEKPILINAAKMAECGYPDERNTMWKNGTQYRLLGMSDLNSTNDQSTERAALERILNYANKDTDLRVYEQPIYKTETYITPLGNEKTRRVSKEERMLTITGKDADRLSARVFTKDDGTIGVVFCGTDLGAGFALADVRDDIKQVVHVAPTPQAYKDAGELLRAVKDAFPDSNIEVFGHSEGGGLAQYAVLHSGILETATNTKRTIKCYTVNAAGLNGLESVNDLKDELKGNSSEDNKKNKALVKKYTEQNFTLIQNEGEWCSRVGYQFGRFIRVTNIDARDDNENEIMAKDCYGKDRSLNDMNRQHGIEETRLKMEYYGDSESDNPFDYEPESKPDDDGNGQMCPIPGKGSTPTTQKPSVPVRRRRGGGGDTSSRIW